MHSQLLYSVPQAAKLLAACPNTVWNLLRDGKLQGVKVGRSRKIAATELERYVASLEAAEVGGAK